MHATLRSRPLIGLFLVAVFGGAAVGACQASAVATDPDVGSASPAISTLTPAPPSPSAAVVDAGTITLTDDGCTWEGNPGSMRAGRVSIAASNETDDYGVFILHRLHPDRTFEEGRALIASIQEALKTGAEWPDAVSDAIDEGAAAAGASGDIAAVTTAGTYGVVCSANTSPTGDILRVFLVGPLEVTAP
jgi:hypothetical protein